MNATEQFLAADARFDELGFPTLHRKPPKAKAGAAVYSKLRGGQYA